VLFDEFYAETCGKAERYAYIQIDASAIVQGIDKLKMIEKDKWPGTRRLGPMIRRLFQILNDIRDLINTTWLLSQHVWFYICCWL
jgi:hypothetical protein